MRSYRLSDQMRRFVAAANLEYLRQLSYYYASELLLLFVVPFWGNIFVKKRPGAEPADTALEKWPPQQGGGLRLLAGSNVRRVSRVTGPN